ncbi:MAG: hypothetical protein M8835_09980 [marine benthic group bacterium]|nr:hypothetical protein [Gemmatimonadota bacterium]
MIWLFGAAAAAAAAAWIRYGIREEKVPGRLVPAFLWACAVFLLLYGLRLPPIRSGPVSMSPRTVLLDISASMDLPVAVGAGSRLDSARARAVREDADSQIQFGREAITASEDASPEAFPVDVNRAGTLLAPALRAARATGADSVIVISDGEFEDREAARREAARLGLGVREIRVAGPVSRTTVREVLYPARVSAGDTIRFRVEIWSPGGEGAATTQPDTDSVTVLATASDGRTASVRTERPAPGRGRFVQVDLPTPASRQETEWRRFEVRLAAGADPLDAQPARSAWIGISPTRFGPVVVSVDPDWEPAHVLPVLERASNGEARAYLRIGPDRWVRAGPDPEAVSPERVRADAASSDLLVVQGAPVALPSWLRTTAARHDRLLLLARGSGPVPGTDVDVGAPVEGEWFLTLPPSPSPVGAFLSGLDAGPLPPVFALRRLQGRLPGTVVEFRRDRRGDALPGVAIVTSGSRRTVIVVAEGTWRWSARTGVSRAVYRALFSGISAWLLEDVQRDPVVLAPEDGDSDSPAGWNVAAGVSDLLLVVRDSTGAEVWRHEAEFPGRRIAGPRLPGGDLSFEVSGNLDGASFTGGHPFSVARYAAEFAGRSTGRSLTIEANLGSDEESGRPGGRGPPVWPFALAALLFCGEWYLRRRLGLR